VDKLGEDSLIDKLKIYERDRGIAYEILNFVDGKKSILEIRNAVSAEYEPVPLGEVKEFLDVLAQAKIIRMK
jgi:aminopeptidase-like protein